MWPRRFVPANVDGSRPAATAAITTFAVEPIAEKPGNEPFACCCAPTYAIARCARWGSVITADAGPATPTEREQTTNSDATPLRVVPMRATPFRASARPPERPERGGRLRAARPVAGPPLPRGFVQPVRRRGRPGSPVPGLTVAGQRRFPTGLRLRDA